MIDPTGIPGHSCRPPHRPAPASRLVRALVTHNPFYVISADLVFIGLRMSFDPAAKAFDTWGLIAGLAGFTLLLAATACLLVRYGRVWDDMRSVLLLVVLMFLAISATIDDVLILHPETGLALAVGGLAFAGLVSEGLLRGMRLNLPALYRGPYYLVLALFFLYPVALRPLLARPEAASSHWALFGFATAAGLAFLTLIPAIRRGGNYVRGNGSPWAWPYYPWTLFGVLGLGVCARSYYLCISLHNVAGYQSIFGFYFLVPFGFAVALLLLEAGLTAGRAGLARFALGVPAGLAGLAMVGHRADPVYERFLGLFEQGLGVAPPAATLILAAGFYAYAAYRLVPLAGGLAAAAVGALAVVGPTTLDPSGLVAPRAWPLLAVGLIAGAEALRRRETAWGALAATCLIGALLAGPGRAWTPDQRFGAAAHLTILTLLVLGAFGRDALADPCRRAGAVGLLGAALAGLTGQPRVCAAIPPDLVGAYPALIGLVAVGYGVLAGGWSFYAVAGVAFLGLGLIFGSQGYVELRQRLAGLDRIAIGLVSFLIATLISLGKAGLPRRRLAAKPHPPRVDL